MYSNVNEKGNMRKQVRLSPGEWDIIRALWDSRERMTVREVLQTIYPNNERAHTTVQTVMNNLEQKGFLAKKKIGLVNFYKPKIKRGEAVRRETQSFVKKVFDGSFQDLANYLVESDNLTLKDIEQLKKLIQSKEEELGRRNS